LLHLVGSSILFYVIDDARTNKNQVTILVQRPWFFFVFAPRSWKIED